MRVPAQASLLKFSPSGTLNGLTYPIRSGVGPEEFSHFRGGLGRTYVLAGQASTTLRIPDSGLALKTTRPLSLIQRDVLSRGFPMSAGADRKRKSKHSSKSGVSPKVTRTLYGRNTESSQSSTVSEGTIEPVRNYAGA